MAHPTLKEARVGAASVLGFDGDAQMAAPPDAEPQVPGLLLKTFPAQSPGSDLYALGGSPARGSAEALGIL